jgi:hypothetical protein
MSPKEKEMPASSNFSFKKTSDGVTDTSRGTTKTGSIMDDRAFSTVKTGGVQKVYNAPVQARRAVDPHFGQTAPRPQSSLAPAEILELEDRIARLATLSGRQNIAPPGFHRVTLDDIVEAGIKSVFDPDPPPELFDIAKRCVVITVLRNQGISIPDVFKKPNKHNPLWWEARQKSRIRRTEPEASSIGAIERMLREALRNRDAKAEEIFATTPSVPESVVPPQFEPTVTDPTQPPASEPPELAGIFDLPAEPQAVAAEAVSEPQRRDPHKVIGRAEVDRVRRNVIGKHSTMKAESKRLGVSLSVISSIVDGKYKARGD